MAGMWMSPVLAQTFAAVGAGLAALFIANSGLHMPGVASALTGLTVAMAMLGVTALIHGNEPQAPKD